MIELCCEYLSVQSIWLYVCIMLCTCFRVNRHCIVVWMSRNFLLETSTINIWNLSDCNMTQIQDHLVGNEHSTIQSNWLNDWVVLWVFICMMHLIVCSYHVTYFFRVNLHSKVAWMSRKSLLKTGTITEI